MNEQKTEQKTKPTNFDFFNQTDIEVTVTYAFLQQTEPMRFFFRVQLAKEEREARQAFFALSEAEQTAKQTEYNARIVSTLSARFPENVPTLEKIEAFAPDEFKTEKQQIFEFFNSDNQLKQKVASDALNLYFSKSQPLEFFR